MLQNILRSTLFTRITLQYYWDEYSRVAKGHVNPKGINIDKRKENYLNLKTQLKTTDTDNKNDLIPKSAAQ